MKKIRCKEWKEYQHYKKNNKNYSKEQPRFRMFGRKLIGERKYMELKPEERDFLVTGCWCIGSQDNGFLPSPEDIAFKMRIEVKEVNLHLKHLLQQDWLEEYAEEDYKKIMNDVHKQVEENQRENGLARVKKESVHEEAQRLTKKMSINNS